MSTRTGSSFASQVLPFTTSCLPPPFPSPPSPPSCLPSCCGSMATQSHRPELKPTSFRNFYFPSLLRDCSQTFHKIPRARQPAYDTRPKECKRPLPRPPAPARHTPDRNPRGLENPPNRQMPLQHPRQSKTQPKRLSRTTQTQSGNPKFSIQGAAAMASSNRMSDLGPRPEKLPADKAPATMTKTNSPQDCKKPRAKKSCVDQKLKFFKGSCSTK